MKRDCELVNGLVEALRRVVNTDLMNPALEAVCEKALVAWDDARLYQTPKLLKPRKWVLNLGECSPDFAHCFRDGESRCQCNLTERANQVVQS